MLVEENTIKDVRHDGHGCSICCSSASVMSNALINKSVKDAEDIIKEYLVMLTGQPYNEEILTGEPIAYIGVSRFQLVLDVLQLPGRQWKSNTGGNK